MNGINYNLIIRGYVVMACLTANSHALAQGDSIGFGFSSGYDQNEADNLEDDLHKNSSILPDDPTVDSETRERDTESDVSGLDPTATTSDVIPQSETSPASDSDPISESESELTLSASEIRASFEYSLSLFAGPSIPWTSGGLESSIFHSENSLSTITIGVGKWDITSRKDQVEYNVNAQSKVIMYWFEYFFSENFPIFASIGAGICGFNGTVNPTSSTASNTANDRLKSSFDSLGSIAGTRLGLMKTWKSGFLLKWTILNFGKYFESSEDHSRDSAESKALVTETTTSPRSWGLTNISLGYAF